MLLVSEKVKRVSDVLNYIMSRTVTCDDIRKVGYNILSVVFHFSL
jgi:hypothetical protein